MARIRVKRLEHEAGYKRPSAKHTADRLCARLCLYYPAYTLAEARRLPAKDVRMMLSVAVQEKYAEYWWLTQIAAAPHTENGIGVDKLTNYFSERLE